MTATLSLYVIEDSLAELLEARVATMADIARIEADTLCGSPEDLAEARQALEVIDKTINEYLTIEVRKVDNYHRYLTAATNLVEEIKAEQKRVADRRRRLEAAIAYLKERTLKAMELADKKRIDGTGGRYLLRKGNSATALVVDGWDPEKEEWSNGGALHSVLPQEFMTATVSMPLNSWLLIADDAPFVAARCHAIIPNNARIREALKGACQACKGFGRYSIVNETVIVGDQGDATCGICSGSGKAVVPGARLGEKGYHLEVK